VSREMEGSWSREQIASGLRLVGSGVPVIEVTEMMGVSPEVFSAWKAEYSELFDRLISRFPEPEQLSTVAKTVGSRRMAYMSGCVGGEEVESELRECKIRYSVIEDVAAVAGELLGSGSVLGTFNGRPSGIVGEYLKRRYGRPTVLKWVRQGRASSYW